MSQDAGTNGRPGASDAESLGALPRHAELVSEVGEQMFVDPISGWSRKLQTVLLSASLFTILLAWDIVEVTTANSSGAAFKWLQPSHAPRIAACISAYVLVLYLVSCYHDFALNDARLAKFIARAFMRLGGVHLRLAAIHVSSAELRDREIKAERKAIQEQRQALEEYRAAESEFLADTMPSYKQERFDELKRILGITRVAQESDRIREQIDALQAEEASLEAAAADLDALFKRYRQHLWLRVWLEVGGVAALTVLAFAIGFQW